MMGKRALLAAGTAVAAIACVYLCDYLPALRRTLAENRTQAVETALAAALPDTAKALRTRDDILLLLGMERLARVPSVTAAYVLGRDGTVIIHANAAQWGQRYADPAHMRAATAADTLAQRLPDRSTLYSMPITGSSATLCAVASPRADDERYARARRRALFTGLLIGLAAITLLLVNARTRSSGGAPDRTGQQRTQHPSGHDALSGTTGPLLVAGPDNRVRAVSAGFVTALALPADAEGQHLLDILGGTELSALIEGARAQRTGMAVGVLRGQRVQCSVFSGGLLLSLEKPAAQE